MIAYYAHVMMDYKLKIGKLNETVLTQINHIRTLEDRLLSFTEDNSKANVKTSETITILSSKLSEEVNKSASWPNGHYCIFKNGNCPPGFDVKHGFLNAIKTCKANANYIKESTFGESRISCHGRCGQYAKRFDNAELHIP